MYKILLESQVKEKPIAYTKWEKCLKKDRMHTLTSEEARRFAHDTHIPSILSTTGCLRFSLKMDFEVKTSRKKKYLNQT